MACLKKKTKAHSRAESGGPGSAQHPAICGPSPPKRNFSTMKCSTTIYTIHIYEPRSGGPAATTETQLQGETPDCQPRGLAPSQAAEQPPPHLTGTGGRRSAGGLTLPPQPLAGYPRSGIVVVRASPAMVCSCWHDDLASAISHVAKWAYSNNPDARNCIDCAL